MTSPIIALRFLNPARVIKMLAVCFWLGVLFTGDAFGGDSPIRVLFFSKSAGYEHDVVYRHTAWPSFAETAMFKLGKENHIVVTFSKDGSIFTPQNIAKYDAFVFYTSGELIKDQRNGWGDNYEMMTVPGRNALLQAIRNGKGFVGLHSAIDTLSEAARPDDDYPALLGADYIGHNELQVGHLIQVDKNFPGMEGVPPHYQPFDQWYALKNFRPDLHVIMALNCSQMTGSLYERPNYPIAWARMEGKGRVFYTSMGHTRAVWEDPVFQQMILAAVRWAAGQADADITPNLGKVTPHANKIPARAGSSSHAMAP
jgi:uncharacterized protein